MHNGRINYPAIQRQNTHSSMGDNYIERQRTIPQEDTWTPRTYTFAPDVPVQDEVERKNEEIALKRQKLEKIKVEVVAMKERKRRKAEFEEEAKAKLETHLEVLRLKKERKELEESMVKMKKKLDPKRLEKDREKYCKLKSMHEEERNELLNVQEQCKKERTTEEQLEAKLEVLQTEHGKREEDMLRMQEETERMLREQRMHEQEYSEMRLTNYFAKKRCIQLKHRIDKATKEIKEMKKFNEGEGKDKKESLEDKINALEKSQSNAVGKDLKDKLEGLKKEAAGLREKQKSEEKSVEVLREANEMCKPIDMSAQDDLDREDLIARLKKELEEVQKEHEHELRTLKVKVDSNKKHRKECREIEKNKRRQTELENEAEPSEDEEELGEGSDAHDSNPEDEYEEEGEVDLAEDEEFEYTEESDGGESAESNDESFISA